jgi:hypothetical protein
MPNAVNSLAWQVLGTIPEWEILPLGMTNLFTYFVSTSVRTKLPPGVIGQQQQSELCGSAVHQLW